MPYLIEHRLGIFWFVMAVVGLLVATLFWRYLALLGRGQRLGGRGLLAAVRRGPPGGWRLFSRHLLAAGLLHRRLWERDKRRWLAHAGMLSGFLGLLLLSFLAALSEHVFLPLGLDSPFVAAFRDMDQPFLAALHETLGLLILLGGLSAGLRRLLGRERQLPNEGPDVLFLGLLLFITAGGYPLESLRLLMEGVPPEVARYSFVGWPIAQALRPLDLDWAAWHFWIFQTHVVAYFVLLIYWPASKFMHVLASPIIAALGAAEEREQ